MTTDKAVALAEKHGARTPRDNWQFAESELIAMLAGHRQQVIAELAQRAEKMPEATAMVSSFEKNGRLNINWYSTGNLRARDEIYAERSVAEAIAAMQAKLEKQYEATVTVLASHGTIRRKLEQSRARVAELEKIVAHNLNAMRP